jgi:uncharacterized protein
MAAEERYPRPRPTGLDKPYWQALRREDLVLQACLDCGTFQWFPRASCTRCYAERLAWQPVDSRGTVFTYTVTHQRVGFAFDKDAPYILAVVEFPVPGTVRMAGVLRGVAPEEVRIGLPVRAAFRHGGTDDDETVLEFAPQ